MTKTTHPKKVASKTKSPTLMKPPITYYGGKQQMTNYIVPLIPAHRLYCEPFLGGWAVFWAKPTSDIEVLNDHNGEVINFYQVVKTKFIELQKRIKATPHSKQLYDDALVIYRHPHLFSQVDRAWAFWVSTNQAFSSNIGAGWSYSRKKNQAPRTTYHKRERFEINYAERLEFVSLDCRNALEVIKKRDTKESFFYVDPPYFNADQWHYKGYTEADFQELLDVLANIQGKFLLSSYPSELLDSYQQKYEWHHREWKTTIRMKHHQKPKTEVLTANYPLEV